MATPNLNSWSQIYRRQMLIQQMIQIGYYLSFAVVAVAFIYVILSERRKR